MEIYLQKDGRRQGPYLIFKIRELLEDGKISLDDLGWHEGMDHWSPLREIEIIQGISKKNATVEDFLSTAENAPPTDPTMVPPPLPQRPHPTMPSQMAQMEQVPGRTGHAWRRFLARSFDNMLALCAFVGIGVAGGWYGPAELGRPEIVTILGALFAWIFIESLLLHKFGRTPGKFLLGMRVVDEEGNLLSLRAAFQRSFDVWLFGMGTGFSFVTIFCQMMAFQRYRIMGVTSWDERGNFRPQQKPPSPFGITIFVLLATCGLCLMAWSTLMYAPELAELRKALLQGGQESLGTKLPQPPQA